MASYKPQYRDLFLPPALPSINGFFQSWTEFMRFPRPVLDESIDWGGLGPPKGGMIWYTDQRGIDGEGEG